MAATPREVNLSGSEMDQHRRRQLRDLVRLNQRHVSPKAKVAIGAGTSGLILLATAYVWLLVFDGMFPIVWGAILYTLIFVCGLATPTAVRLLRQGIVELQGPGTARSQLPPPSESAAVLAEPGKNEKYAERQLLEAIERHGEITPVKAALETTLTVAEADRLLSDLAKKGHVEVRVEGGTLVYSL
jgi:hypothetical protein